MYLALMYYKTVKKKKKHFGAICTSMNFKLRAAAQTQRRD